MVFGVLVRLVLWPLNQKAMKSQVAMMAVQPVLLTLLIGGIFAGLVTEAAARTWR